VRCSVAAFQGAKQCSPVDLAEYITYIFRAENHTKLYYLILTGLLFEQVAGSIPDEVTEFLN
jgi:hypothetical protein